MRKFNSIEEKVISEKLLSALDRQQEQIIESSKQLPLQIDGIEAIDSSRIAHSINDIGQYINQLDENRENLAFREIHSHRKLIGGLILFVKKVIRKSLKWYIEPICFQQTDFNNAVTPSIGKLNECQSELLAAVTMLENNQKHIEQYYIKKLDVARTVERSLSQKIQQIENKNKISQKQLIEKIDKLEEKYNEAMQKICELESSEVKLKDNIVSHMNANGSELQNKVDYKLNQIDDYYKTMEQTLAESIENIENHQIIKVNELEQKIVEIGNIQKLANIQIEASNSKLAKLNEMGLDIFKDESQNFWSKNTVAQSGEDSIIAYIVMVLGIEFKDCTYLDLGANHAKDLSNTYWFYNKGARGVLVEANPELIPELKFYRSGDRILNKCISTTSGEKVDFYVLNGDGLSTPDINAANEFIAKNPTLSIIKTVSVETITVNEIIESYLGKAPIIMSVDVEGKDMEILESIDFEKYRPLVIITEMIEYKTALVVGEKNKKIVELMESKGYIEYAFTGINSIFIDQRQIGEGK